VAHAGEHLPSKRETKFNPSTAKKGKRRRMRLVFEKISHVLQAVPRASLGIIGPGPRPGRAFLMQHRDSFQSVFVDARKESLVCVCTSVCKSRCFPRTLWVIYKNSWLGSSSLVCIAHAYMGQALALIPAKEFSTQKLVKVCTCPVLPAWEPLNRFWVIDIGKNTSRNGQSPFL
jgi:hypothetical protein